ADAVRLETEEEAYVVSTFRWTCGLENTMLSKQSVMTILAALAILLSANMTAQQQTRFVLLTSSGPIGTLTVTEDGRSTDTVYRVDDNGRGSKLTEHVELGPDGLPKRWDVQGTSWFGAPVKESFIVENGKAK